MEQLQQESPRKAYVEPTLQQHERLVEVTEGTPPSSTGRIMG